MCKNNLENQCAICTIKHSIYYSTSLAKKETFTIQDEEQFKSKIMADGNSPTIVDFSATWCGPCKLLTPR